MNENSARLVYKAWVRRHEVPYDRIVWYFVYVARGGESEKTMDNVQYAPVRLHFRSTPPAVVGSHESQTRY